MLQVDPRRRPTIQDVCERLEEIAVARNVDLKAPAIAVRGITKTGSQSKLQGPSWGLLIAGAL